MKQELYDAAGKAIQIAKSSGADDCRVSVGGERFVEIGYRERKPENIKEASTKGLRVEIFVNKRYSSQSTSDLRPDSLKTFIANAVASTKLLAEDPFRTLPDPKYYQGRAALDLKQYDPDYENVTPESRHRFVKAIEEGCLAKGGDKVISVSARGYDSHEERLLMTSNGFDGYQEATVFYGVAQMTAKDEGDRRPAEYGVAVTLSRKALPKPEDIGAEAATRALQLLGAKKIKTETLPIIIENRVVGDFGDGFMQAMFGRSIQQKQSFLADKKGQKVGSQVMSIIDDPFIPGAMGSGLFDREGMTSKKRIMIDAGVLKEFYVDWYYSRKLGWEPTTGSPTGEALGQGDHERPGPRHPHQRVHRRELQLHDGRYFDRDCGTALRKGGDRSPRLGDEHRRQPPQDLAEAGGSGQRPVSLFSNARPESRLQRRRRFGDLIGLPRGGFWMFESYKAGSC
jgi:PmbA protein